MTAPGDSPYVGPRPFRPGEELWGRDWESDELRNLILAKRIVLLYSPSGAGKTSLIHAKLTPALVEAGLDPLPIIRLRTEVAAGAGPGVNPYVHSTILSLNEGLSAAERDNLPRDDLSAYLAARRHLSTTALRILIFDQFEDVLTQDPTDNSGRDVFFYQLGEALADYSLYALFAMREEYLAGLDPYLDEIPNRFGARMRLTPLDPESAFLAITEPAQARNVKFADDAARQLVDDLRTTLVQATDGSVQPKLGHEIEGLQLQVVCERVWLQSNKSNITLNDIGGSGGAGTVESALSTYYDEKVAAVARATGTLQSAIRSWFERKLITRTKLRGQVIQSDAETELGVDTISLLKDAGLIRAEPRRGVPWLELAHDTFIAPVVSSNARYCAANPNPIADAAALWDSAEWPEKLLFQADELARAERWALAHPDELSAVQKDFLERSRKLEKERLAAAERALSAQRRTNFADIGWGVIFAANESPQVIEALQPLLEHRRRQANAQGAGSYREFTYIPGDTTRRFLVQNGASSGPASPERVPYYLLIVGDPERIPFEFQFGFGVQYAVGRIAFDTAAEYGNYARSVVASESGSFALARGLALFGPKFPQDTPTALVNERFLKPLVSRLAQAHSDWTIDCLLEEYATKERLTHLLASDAPAFIMAAGHGITYTSGHPNQASQSGALVCADFRGRESGPLRNEDLFTASDVPPNTGMLGTIAFLATESSAGLPKFDSYVTPGTAPAQISPSASIAQLPRRLLSHPDGAMLAVIGHVDRLWMSSFADRSVDVGIRVFERFLDLLLGGHTVGSAMEIFRQRYALLASQLLSDVLPAISGSETPGTHLAASITEAVDVRNYIILGDPAVRCPIRTDGTVIPRTALSSPAVLESVETTGEDSTGLPALLTFNGIDADTGQYTIGPLPLQEVVALALSVLPDEDNILRTLATQRSQARL